MFSKDFKTYSEWKKAHPEDTPYNRRIINEHKKHPNATLSQLRGHPKGKQKPVSKLKTKKPKKMQIMVKGIEVTDDRNETGTLVYYEFYIESTRSEEQIAKDIEKYIKKNGINLYPSEESYDEESKTYKVINFRENVPDSGKPISQKQAKKELLDKLKENLHKAKPKSYWKSKEYRDMLRQKRLDNNEYKKEYDNNEF